MSRRSRQEIIEEYGKEYRNYSARYRRAVKKYGIDYMPDKIERKAKTDIRAADIGILTRQRAGLFESVAKERGWEPTPVKPIEEKSIQPEPEKPKHIPDKVIKILNDLEKLGDIFVFDVTRRIYKRWFNEIKGRYTPQQIAYIYEEKMPDILYNTEMIARYEDEYITNPKTHEYITYLTNLFSENCPPELLAEEYYEDTSEFYYAGAQEDWENRSNFQ